MDGGGGTVTAGPCSRLIPGVGRVCAWEHAKSWGCGTRMLVRTSAIAYRILVASMQYILKFLQATSPSSPTSPTKVFKILQK